VIRRWVIVQTMRGQREDACKCSGANSNHQQQGYAKAAYCRREDKRTDAECGADLPDELFAGWSRYACGHPDAILHHGSERDSAEAGVDSSGMLRFG
jgi:hypothetical protein